MKTMWIACVALVAVGCVPEGGGRDGDPGAVADGGVGGPGPGGNEVPDLDELGVGEDDRVADLSDDEIAAVCTALEDRYSDALSDDDAAELACIGAALFVGLFDQDDPVGSCGMACDSCQAEPDVEEPNPEPCPLSENPECTATIAQIDTCIADRVAGARLLIDTFDCALLNDLANLPDEGQDSAACLAVDEACPGLLDDDDEGPFNEAEPSP